MKQPTSRAKAFASVAVTAGLCLAGATAVTSPSQAATGSCDTAYPVADLTAGQAVNGLTVSSGTTPEAFTGDVIGVLKDGIEPGVDMVMMNLSSPAIDNAGGIWEGMSGSPVYATDGSLIGAVAYTLSYGATPIAGITPWEDMQQYAGSNAEPIHVRVSKATARTIARRTSVSAKQASQGFQELPTPTVVAGLSARMLAHERGRPYLNAQATPAGRAPSVGGPDVSDMISGGNLVATMSSGDVVQGGLGTITSVCDGRVVGFGHPMNFVGKTTYGMAGADALFIQSDSLGSPFKVANLGDTLGTIDQDRMTGISGPLGVDPASLPVTSTVTYHPDGGSVRSRTGSSEVQLPIAAAGTANYEMVLNDQAVLDAYQAGSDHQSWTVTGHTDSGPFTFTGGNRYTDGADIIDASIWDMPDLVWLLSNISGVTLDSIDVSSTITDDTATLKIAGAEQKRGGSWHPVDKTHPALVKAGSTATLRLLYAGGSHGKAFALKVPASAAGMTGRLFASAAEAYPFEQGNPHSLAGVKKLADGAVRNDQAQIELVAFGNKGKPVQLDTTTKPGQQVITGHQSFKVKVS
jgi:SpoIVB peptidase S55